MRNENILQKSNCFVSFHGSYVYDCGTAVAEENVSPVEENASPEENIIPAEENVSPVSPIMGVRLQVAITVILAAAIGW